MRHPFRAAIAATLVITALASRGCTNPTVKQLLTIGSSCSASSECGSQPQFYCNLTLAGGYCMKDCKSDADCPSESICAFDSATIGRCHLKCDITANCRFTMMYGCRPASKDPERVASHGYCGLAEDATPADMSMPGDASVTDGAQGD